MPRPRVARRLSRALGLRCAALPPAAARRAGAGVVHAAGRPLAAGVPGGPGRHRHAGQLQPARPGRRDHPAAGPPLRRRRGHLLLRHHGAAQGGRGRPGHRPRPRAGDRRTRCADRATWSRSGRWRPTRSGTSPRRSGCWWPSSAATPLIGFAGAPFTLASYLVEGGPSKDYARTKAMMVGEPELWDGLCSRLAELSATFLQVQVAAGAARGAAVRLLGGQPERGGLRAVRPAVLGAGARRAGRHRRAADPLRGRHLGAARPDGRGRRRGGRGGLAAAAGRGQPADRARVRGAGQPRPGAARRPRGRCWPSGSARWCDPAPRRPGHIFNLGHGVPPDTDPDVLARIVDLVHTEGAELRGRGGGSGCASGAR